MRTLLKVTIPVEQGNRAIKDVTLERTMENTLNKLRPETSYFYADNGRRTALIVFDLKNTADIPAIAEPFFLELNANVEFSPVMNVEDLKKGLAAAMESLAVLKH